MLLWGHAIPFAASVGRIQLDWISGNDHAIGTGKGGYNGDVWKMAVQLNPGSKFVVDMSSHPIYKGHRLRDLWSHETHSLQGAGWTEDHNCLFFNLPSQLTGLGNQDLAIYHSHRDLRNLSAMGMGQSDRLGISAQRMGSSARKYSIQGNPFSASATEVANSP